MNDINGIELQEGDSVVIAYNQFDSPRLVKGIVTKIGMRKPRRREPQPCVTVSGSMYTFNPESRIMKIEE